jgi:hypothetical protein
MSQLGIQRVGVLAKDFNNPELNKRLNELS